MLDQTMNVNLPKAPNVVHKSVEFRGVGLFVLHLIISSEVHSALNIVWPSSTGCPRMFYTVFQKNIKNIKSTMSLIIILVIECLICVLPTVKISFTYLYPFGCDMVSLKIDE